MKVSFLLAALGASLLVSTSALAAKRTFSANMDPGQENTPPDVGAHNPTGKITVTFDDVTKELCGKIEYTDLTGIASGVHIHRAPAGNPEGDSAPTDKVELPPTASPVAFNIKLSADFEKALVNPENPGEPELYANIHTAANTKGELRSESPWIEDDGLTAVPCPPPTTTGGTDAGADAGKSSSSSSGSTSSGSSSGESSSSGSTSSGDDDDSTSTSSSGGSSAKDAGAAGAKKKDDGGCNTTGDGGHLGFAMVLGVGIAALSRVRRRRRR